MRFEVRLSKKASKQLDSLDNSIRRRILQRLEELEEEPFPLGAIKLQGWENIYRVRVGDCRILYEILRKERLLLIDKIDHRSKVYGP